uniref:hypothetical protein n=1 Tax=Algoriphagus sp. TaxID=1872435 RepID=UPI004047BBFA
MLLGTPTSSEYPLLQLTCNLRSILGDKVIHPNQDGAVSDRGDGKKLQTPTILLLGKRHARLI